MPATSRAGKKRSRASACPAKDPFALLLDMEEPLTDAINTVQALRLMGHGLILHDETGSEPIVALAWMTAQRLDAVKEIWNKMLEARRRGKS
jgi:hypothetical protein